MAAARCSLTHVLAVPGTPSSSSARSVATVVGGGGRRPSRGRPVRRRTRPRRGRAGRRRGGASSRSWEFLGDRRAQGERVVEATDVAAAGGVVAQPVEPGLDLGGHRRVEGGGEGGRGLQERAGAVAGGP